MSSTTSNTRSQIIYTPTSSVAGDLMDTTLIRTTFNTSYSLQVTSLTNRSLVDQQQVSGYESNRSLVKEWVRKAERDDIEEGAELYYGENEDNGDIGLYEYDFCPDNCAACVWHDDLEEDARRSCNEKAVQRDMCSDYGSADRQHVEGVHFEVHAENDDTDSATGSEEDMVEWVMSWEFYQEIGFTSLDAEDGGLEVCIDYDEYLRAEKPDIIGDWVAGLPSEDEVTGEFIKRNVLEFHIAQKAVDIKMKSEELRAEEEELACWSAWFEKEERERHENELTEYFAELIQEQAKRECAKLAEPTEKQPGSAPNPVTHEGHEQLAGQHAGPCIDEIMAAEDKRRKEIDTWVGPEPVTRQTSAWKERYQRDQAERIRMRKEIEDQKLGLKQKRVWVETWMCELDLWEQKEIEEAEAKERLLARKVAKCIADEARVHACAEDAALIWLLEGESQSQCDSEEETWGWIPDESAWKDGKQLMQKLGQWVEEAWDGFIAQGIKVF